MPRKKQLPPFSHERKEGDIKILTPRLSSYNTGYGEGLIMTPYSDYIPICYLTANEIVPSIYNGNEYTIHNTIGRILKWRKIPSNYDRTRAFAKRLASSPGMLLDLYMWELEDFENRKILKYVNDFINYDKPICLNNSGGWATRRYSDVIRTFKMGDYTHQFRTASAAGECRAGIVTVKRNVSHPLVVMAIPKESYFYSKLYYLKHKAIDLSKCIVLIDRELDNTSFPERGIRNNLYKKEIMPYLESLSIDVWKVPGSYIEEKCFLGEYQLRAKNLVERKKEIEEIRQRFCTERREKYNKEKEVLFPPPELGEGLLSMINRSSSATTYTYNPSMAAGMLTQITTSDSSGPMWVGGVDPVNEPYLENIDEEILNAEEEFDIDAEF